MKNRIPFFNSCLLLFFFQNVLLGQNNKLESKNIKNIESPISKTVEKLACEEKLVGTYEMGNPLLWGTKLVLYSDYRFNYSSFDDVSHINIHGKWSYSDSNLILNSDEQLKDFVQIKESIDKKMKAGEKKFQVLDENGTPVVAKFNINYEGKRLNTDDSGIVRGKVDEMNSFFISNCEKNVYPDVFILKNNMANKITIKYIKPYNALFNKILTDEHWLFENQKIYPYSEKGEINRTIFFMKKEADDKNNSQNRNSPK